MNSKKFWSDWLFPILSLIIFVTLFMAMVSKGSQAGGGNLGNLISYPSGMLAYAMMLTVTFMGSRPRFLEKHFGMPKMFAVHSLMSVVAAILIAIHILIEWSGFQTIAEMSPSTRTGWVATLAFIIVMYTGIFSLSGIFVKYSKTLTRFKEKRNRELNLWLHRLAIISIIFVYLHLLNLDFLRSNTLFMTLLTIYTVFTLGYWAVWKIKLLFLPKYKVSNLYQGTPTTWVLEVAPQKGSIPHYNPGEYFWIHFKDADISKEGHPISASSAITNRYHNSIEFMIKEAGDWSKALKNVKVGDSLILEGPYGDMYPPAIQALDESVPFVLLGGGIGLTPLLSILRHEREIHSQREIHLVLGLAYEEDLFMLDELKAMQKENPNFHLHVIFSEEEVAGYPTGYITYDFIDQVGANHYANGHYFVCGPSPMIEAVKDILDQGKVSYNQRHIDDFSF